jgi:hypothetical protein
MEDHREPQQNRTLLIAGAALALAAGLGGAMLIMSRDDGSSRPPPASQGGLVVEAIRPADNDRLDPARPLRCFVDGQFVGELTLAECAERNGVATGSLDVGLDETGALAAADVAGTVLTPLPPPQSSVVVTTPPPLGSAQPTPVSTGTCWRYSREGWRSLGDMPRGACVQTLFAGQCANRGGADYGRWGEQTLRLVTGRVEISGDNRRFRTLVEQGPGCSLPSVD